MFRSPVSHLTRSRVTRKLISPEILVMLPEVKSQVARFFLSLVKTSKWHIFRNSLDINRLKHPLGVCIYVTNPSIVKMSLLMRPDTIVQRTFIINMKNVYLIQPTI